LLSKSALSVVLVPTEAGEYWVRQYTRSDQLLLGKPVHAGVSRVVPPLYLVLLIFQDLKRIVADKAGTVGERARARLCGLVARSNTTRPRPKRHLNLHLTITNRFYKTAKDTLLYTTLQVAIVHRLKYCWSKPECNQEGRNGNMPRCCAAGDECKHPDNGFCFVITSYNVTK
jgi:hypothetical protein